jgi:hypothetical protein
MKVSMKIETKHAAYVSGKTRIIDTVHKSIPDYPPLSAITIIGALKKVSRKEYKSANERDYFKGSDLLTRNFHPG